MLSYNFSLLFSCYFYWLRPSRSC